MGTEVEIKPTIIKWAIERAGIELNEIKERIPQIQDWLDNKKNPTIKQLQSFAKKVHVPFGFLFADTPPDIKIPFPFFRTNNAASTSVSVNVYDAIMVIQQRQEWLSDYLQETESNKLDFVGKYNIDNHPKIEEITSDIRKTLGLAENWASQVSNWENALDLLTESIENAGIIVTFNSIVENNTHRGINVDECRGFVMVDEYAPFMFINSADSKTAQMFTIMHELAHVWFGESAGFDFEKLQPADNKLEQICDSIAAEFLVPQQLFEKIWNNDFAYCARYFKVSQIVIARRALDLGKISRHKFFEFYNNAQAAYIEKKSKQQSGGDFYATTKKRLSLKFANYINQAVHTERLLYRDAFKLSGLKGKTFDEFFNKNFG